MSDYGSASVHSWVLLLVCSALIQMGCEPQDPQEADLVVSSSQSPANPEASPGETGPGNTPSSPKGPECATDLDCVIAAGEVSVCARPMCIPDTLKCISHTRPNCCESNAECASNDPCLVGSCPIQGAACVYNSVRGGCDTAGRDPDDVDRDDARDSNTDSAPDDDSDADDDSNADDDSDPEHGSDANTDEDADQDTDEDADDGADEDTDEDADQDTDEDADEDTDEDADQDTDEDADEDAVDDADDDADEDNGGKNKPKQAIIAKVCATYCKLVTTHCVNDYAIDFGPKGCPKTCKGYDLDPNANPAASNTLNCRLYQAAAAAADPANHCSSAAPAGGDLCNGSNPYSDKTKCGDQPNEWPGDITFSSTTMMEGFCLTYDTVCGNVNVEQVQNTEALGCLRWVGGQLSAGKNNPADGSFNLVLHKLHRVGHLVIGANVAVVNLPKLAYVGQPNKSPDGEEQDWSLYISTATLQSLKMPSLVSVAATFHITGDAAGFWKQGKPAGIEIELPLLRNADYFRLDNLWTVKSVSLPALEQTQQMVVTNCKALESFSAPSLETVGFKLEIQGNKALKALNLASLESTTAIDINNNTNLLAITLDSLVTVEHKNTYWDGRIRIWNNNELTSIAMPSLKTVGSIWIKNAAALAQFDAPSLVKVGTKGLTLDNLGVLATLDGLNGLKLTGAVDIRNNCQLADVSGLKGIESVNGAFQIVDNATLTDAQGLAVQDAIGFENISGGVLIYGNDGNGACP